MTIFEIMKTLQVLVQGTNKELTEEQFLYLLNLAKIDLFKQFAGSVMGAGADIDQKTVDALAPFAEHSSLTLVADSTVLPGLQVSRASLPTDYSGYGQVWGRVGTGTPVLVNMATMAEALNRLDSAVTYPTVYDPIYFISNQLINIFPHTVTTAELFYYREPISITYGLNVEAGGYYSGAGNLEIGLEFEVTYHPDIIKLLLKYLGLDPSMISEFAEQQQSKRE